MGQKNKEIDILNYRQLSETCNNKSSCECPETPKTVHAKTYSSTFQIVYWNRFGNYSTDMLLYSDIELFIC
jgi:hypothetical protein